MPTSGVPYFFRSLVRFHADGPLTLAVLVCGAAVSATFAKAAVSRASEAKEFPLGAVFPAVAAVAVCIATCAVAGALVRPFVVERTLAAAGVDGAECAITSVRNSGEKAAPEGPGWVTSPSAHAASGLLRPRKPRPASETAYPPPYPNGWFVVMPSHALKAGEAKYVVMLGLHLAVFREEGSGKVHAVDAFCPHLGANLGVGGTVEGDSIVCPFHAWKFNGDTGDCTDIPYTQGAIPPGARVKSHTVSEVNRLVVLWFDAEGRGPQWDVEALPELRDGSSYTLHGETTHRVSAHMCQLPENGSDASHFGALHGSFVVRALQPFGFKHEWKATWAPDGHMATMTVRQGVSVCGRTLPMTTTNTLVRQCGPGVVYFRFATAFGNVVALEVVTPIEPLLQRVHHLVFSSAGVPRFVAKTVLSGMITQYERDAMVFNNAMYRPAPLLVKEDVNIGRFRKWFKQFYSKSSAEVQTRQSRPCTNTWDW